VADWSNAARSGSTSAGTTIQGAVASAVFEGLRLSMRERGLYHVADLDAVGAGAARRHSAHPLVAQAHRVRLRVRLLLEEAKLHVEALVVERRVASVEGKLGAVTDPADDGICPHLIGPKRRILVGHHADGTRRRE
jgi:hypothetical protein